MKERGRKEGLVKFWHFTSSGSGQDFRRGDPAINPPQRRQISTPYNLTKLMEEKLAKEAIRNRKPQIIPQQTLTQEQHNLTFFFLHFRPI